ncbi:hypothetical protein GCM10027275_15320 [Rhabdobacter roseus]|uniref:Endonuclease n=1 Tax=Rhabdobacter roseus TaxID=1655419 RepID=A0A840TPG2_9BACT|nr:DNA/RNA non-specific endonuclease [Rhabdobacter roseus]MBB5283452.1 endonuclease G [Rhabdobacter roseus]
MAHFQRRGFRWNTNSFILLLIFFVVGLFLHYGGKTQPVVKFWTDVKSIFTTERPKDNPYKAPEPAQVPDAPDASEPDNVATDTRPERKVPTSPAEVPSAKATDAEALELARIANQRDFFLPATTPSDQLVRRTGYTLKYFEKYEQAAWVAQVLTAQQIQGKEARENVFLNDPEVKSGSAVTADYTRSGYDRGHLAPAADFKNSSQAMKESFYMSNVSPQDPAFNRGVWSELEKLVRAWAYKYDKIYVVTGPVLKPGLQEIGRLNRVAVPEQFYKVVLYVNPPYVKGIAFLMKNEGSDLPLHKFVVSIDEVERLTGIDFFPRLPDDIERRVEARSNPREWYRLQ